MAFKFELHAALSLVGFQNNNRPFPVKERTFGEVGQAISELSRELSTNEIALFSIVFSAEFGQKNLHLTENKSRKNININIFLQNFKCSSITAKDLVISAKISEVNVIFNAILMFEVSRLPATC